MVTGFNMSRFCAIPTTPKNFFALDPNTLREQIKKDKENGLIPLYVCATVGTTSSTAVDPVEEIGKICEEENIWYHVDSAFAAASLCEEYRWSLKGLNYATSFNFNPHKWLMTPADCSALWVESKKDLVNSLIITPEYLRNKESSSGAVDFKDWGIALGRRFRSLKLWFVLRSYGLSGLREIIRKHIKLTQFLREKLESDSRFEVDLPSPFGLLLFRIKGSNNQIEQGNKETEKLKDDLLAKNNILVSHTILAGKYYIRFSSGSPSFEQKHMEEALNAILEGTKRIQG
eukprot:TRINITY_DN454_c0_g1_i2.p1 TRINITY_DN454_c0_g1~~TRINITY_DN454_c0_g1_i2.p1  ORF type:complete len:288 (+),score=63.69 TRINITY_DN454_c0_g1_i2:993-1856(+)